MSPITKTLGDVAARVAFRTAEVTAVTGHGPRFRSIELSGGALRGATWSLGDKLQVRTDPEGFAARTYTPMGWDPERGTTHLLTFSHGEGPGSQWASSVSVGDRCQVFGPRRSLALARATTPVVLVGDETSFALAAAWRTHRPDTPPIAIIFEVDDPDEARQALAAVGVRPDHLVTRIAGDRHLPEMAALLVAVLDLDADAGLCLTGRAQTIAVLRRAVKESPVAGRPSLVKAYWDENRTGLD